MKFKPTTNEIIIILAILAISLLTCIHHVNCQTTEAIVDSIISHGPYKKEVSPSHIYPGAWMISLRDSTKALDSVPDIVIFDFTGWCGKAAR